MALTNLMRSSLKRPKHVLPRSILEPKSAGALQKFGTKQITQVVRAAFAFHLYEKFGHGFEGQLLMLFNFYLLLVTSCSVAIYMLLVLDSKQHRILFSVSSM